MSSKSIEKLAIFLVVLANTLVVAGFCFLVWSGSPWFGVLLLLTMGVSYKSNNTSEKND